MRVYSEIYGCSASMADGEIALGLLKDSGFKIVERPEEADINLIVTCAVKRPTADRMIHRIRVLNSTGKPLIVAGCMVTGERESVVKASPRAHLVAPRDITKVASIAKRILSLKDDGIDEETNYKLGFPRVRQNPVVAIVPVSEGCRWSMCTFCIVPRTRGGRRDFVSYPIRMIRDEIRNSLKEGCKEVWLTSQDMGSYGMESGRNLLPTLLDNINEIEGRFFVRVGMMNPIYLKPILYDLISSYKGKKIFKFLHLPVQSGSENVLRHMKRGHSVDIFEEIIRRFKQEIPHLSLMTDLIIGYPTETEEDFEKTISLIERVRPDSVNISRFFPRPGTEAERLKPLPPDVVDRRSREIRYVCDEAAKKANEKWIGWEGLALVDEVGKNDTMVCRNESYKPIVVKCSREYLGKFIEVRVEEIGTYCLYGRIVSMLG